MTIHGDNHRVFNNYFENTNIGIEIRGENLDHLNSKNCYIVNNTIVNAKKYGMIFGERNFSIVDVNNIYNNLLHYDPIITDNSRKYFYQEITDGAKNIIFNSNCVTTAVSDNTGSYYTSGITYIRQSSIKIYKSSDGIYRLNSGSYAIDKGLPLYFLTTDFEGQNRNNVDIGADEYSTAINKVILTSNDVGPDYNINSNNTGNLSGSISIYHPAKYGVPITYTWSVGTQPSNCKYYWKTDNCIVKTNSSTYSKVCSFDGYTGNVTSFTLTCDVGYSNGVIKTYSKTINEYHSNGYLEPKSFDNKDIQIVIIEYSLSQNYPNPFNPTSKISYSVKNVGLVTIKVFNILGQQVAELINEIKQPGNYEVNFDGSKLASGVYIYKMQAGEFTDVKKMVLLR